jgi:hypothetical protein
MFSRLAALDSSAATSSVLIDVLERGDKQAEIGIALG